MNSSGPRVSVCIPVYNGSDYIAESIQSVLDQTYENFRIIVSDNCSADNTGEIVRSFRDPRITHVRNPRNLGLVGNSNRCIELADGEFICILHHDDVMLPDNLERKVRLLDEHQNVGFVHSNIILIDSRGDIVSWNIWNEDSRNDYVEDGMTIFQKMMDYLPFGSSIFIGAVLARRECYKRLGGFSSELPHCNDSGMWLRMALFYDVACIGTPLVKYRVHPMSTSSSWGDYTSISYLKEHFLAASMVLEEYKDRIPLAGNLKRQVAEAFGMQALAWAYKDLSNGAFASGRPLFEEALNIFPGIFRSALFWKGAARLAAGPVGMQFYRMLKKRSLAEKHMIS